MRENIKAEVTNVDKANKVNIRDLFRIYDRKGAAREPERNKGVGDGSLIEVSGWIRTNRSSKSFGFIELNDGTCFKPLQVVYEKEFIDNYTDISKLLTAAAVRVEGVLELTPEGKQPFELKARKIEIEAGSDPSYPLQKKRHSMEFLREIAHLRPRSNTFSAVFRVRSLLAYAIHRFFQERGFIYVHTPVITGSDAEGAGEMFRVTTLDLENPPRRRAQDVRSAARETDGTKHFASGEPVTGGAKSATSVIGAETSSETAGGKAGIAEDVKMQTDPDRSENQAKAPEYGGPVDYTKDFFGKPASLTVSGQLEGEAFALAFKNIYTFGPTFRAENSNTARHASEFWMIEPEIAFADLADDMNLAEDMIRYIISYVLENAPDEITFFDSFISKGLYERLSGIIESDFVRITYTEAVEILKDSGRKFEFPVEWGIDLQTEHERYLTDEYFKRPVFVTDYPKDIKAFYMRLNDDGETVAAADLLAPGIGEIIGGSQREERLDVLKARMAKLGLAEDGYEWYLDLRKYGGVKHAGFGLGFDRMVMYVTGMANIRDVIPFPRTPKSLEF